MFQLNIQINILFFTVYLRLKLVGVSHIFQTFFSFASGGKNFEKGSDDFIVRVCILSLEIFRIFDFCAKILDV